MLRSISLMGLQGRTRFSAARASPASSARGPRASCRIVPSPAAAGIPVAHDDRGRIAVDASMRSRSHPEVWALGDCANIPGPDGRPYPALAQHAIREARTVARNVAGVIVGRPPAPFVYRPLGTMASLGHSRAVAQVLGFRLRGFPAWWLRRTYYLLQMPRWERRLRIVLD